ncbi:MAG TPA: VOC family protein [Thermoleophilaceae bacterium]|nr:VOC family protein [Thermoleophilaceae bacterium]
MTSWPAIIPYIRYEDAPAMLTWLEDAFGFRRHAVHEEGDRIVHAEITFGNGMFMVGSTGDDEPEAAQTPRQLGGKATGGMYVVVEDVDAHCAQARAAGAEIVREPEEQDYGSRDYSARDPEGHTWSFGTYRPT